MLRSPGGARQLRARSSYSWLKWLAYFVDFVRGLAAFVVIHGLSAETVLCAVMAAGAWFLRDHVAARAVATHQRAPPSTTLRGWRAPALVGVLFTAAAAVVTILVGDPLTAGVVFLLLLVDVLLAHVEHPAALRALQQHVIHAVTAWTGWPLSAARILVPALPTPVVTAFSRTHAPGLPRPAHQDREPPDPGWLSPCPAVAAGPTHITVGLNLQ